MALDKEILNQFQIETNELIKELGKIVEGLEETDAFPDKLLAEFAQRIDRIMGAAKTLLEMDSDHLGLQSIGRMAEICKLSGYKLAEKKLNALVPIVVAFWADALETIELLNNNLDDQTKTAEIVKSFSLVLEKRLTWLATKVDSSLADLGKSFR